MNRIRGVDNVARLDEELYHDFETDADRAVSWRRERKGVHQPASALSKRETECSLSLSLSLSAAAGAGRQACGLFRPGRPPSH